MQCVWQKKRLDFVAKQRNKKKSTKQSRIADEASAERCNVF